MHPIALLVLFIIAVLVILGAFRVLGGWIEDWEIREYIRYKDAMELGGLRKKSEVSDSNNVLVEVNLGSVIVHPDAIKEIGEAGAKLLEAGGAYYDKERGIFVLEGNRKGEINTRKIKQLLAKIPKDED